MGKVDELASTTSDLNPDLVLITETWCRPDITDAFLRLPGYELQTDLRRDRQDTTNGIGGGLLVYSKQGLNILPVDSNCDFNQHCSFKVLTGPDQVCITLVYRPPSAGVISLDGLVELVNSSAGNSILLGDFNLPAIDWETGQATGRSATFLEACRDQFLEQLVNFPTHVKGNILDLLLTNVPDRFLEVSNEGRLGNSDHCMILAKLALSSRPTCSNEKVPNWHRADWEGLKAQLSATNLKQRMENSSAAGAWEIFKGEILDAVATNVPTKPRRTHNRPTWMTRDILRALRRKRRLWRQERTATPSAVYRDTEKKVKNLIRNAKRAYERRLANNTGNSRPFYAYLKRKTKNKTSVGPLKDKNGGLVPDDLGMATLLNDYFSSVFSRDQGINQDASHQIHLDEMLSNVTITEEKVKAKIKKLKPSAAPGPDSIGAGLLQELTTELTPALTVLNRKVLDENYTPEDWKSANVMPIFKKRGQVLSQQLPPSLTNFCCLQDPRIADPRRPHGPPSKEQPHQQLSAWIYEREILRYKPD